MSLIQQALKRQQDEAKGKIVLPPPHLGSTQLAVKPEDLVKPPMFLPAPPVAAPEHSGDEHQRLKLAHALPPVPPVSFVQTPPVSTPEPPQLSPTSAPPVVVAPVSTLKFAHPQVSAVAAEPAPISAEARTDDGSSGLKAARLFVVLLLVAVVIYWFWWRPKNDVQTTATNTDDKAAASVSTKPARPASGLTEGQPVVKHIGPLPDVKDIKTKVNAMKTAVAASRDELPDVDKGIEAPVAPTPETKSPFTPVAVMPTPPAPKPEVKPAPAPTPEPVVAKPAPAPLGPVAWPTMTVNGVMPREDKTQASAIINGNIISVGESVDGMTVLEVRDRGVLMEYKGEQKFLGIGRR